MAYTRGDSTQIIVGAAALFTYENGPLPEAGILQDMLQVHLTRRPFPMR